MPQDFAQCSELGRSEKSLTFAISSAADSSDRIVTANAVPHGKGKNRSQQTDDPPRRTFSTSHNGPAAFPASLYIRCGFSIRNRPTQPLDVRRQHVARGHCSDQRHDVPIHTAAVAVHSARLVAVRTGFKVSSAEFTNGHGLSSQRLFPRRVERQFGLGNDFLCHLAGCRNGHLGRCSDHRTAPSTAPSARQSIDGNEGLAAGRSDSKCKPFLPGVVYGIFTGMRWCETPDHAVGQQYVANHAPWMSINFSGPGLCHS